MEEIINRKGIQDLIARVVDARIEYRKKYNNEPEYIVLPKWFIAMMEADMKKTFVDCGEHRYFCGLTAIPSIKIDCVFEFELY